MSTFAGSYVQEPEHLRSVCSEQTIIRACDDKKLAANVSSFAALTVEARAAIVGVMNELIAGIEGEINSYARQRGYVTPLNPVDAHVILLEARMLHVALLRRSGGMSATDAEKAMKAFRDGALSDIATGRQELTAAKSVAGAPSSQRHFLGYSDASTRDERGVELTRAELDRVF